jgi:hypothetical protein
MHSSQPSVKTGNLCFSERNKPLIKGIPLTLWRTRKFCPLTARGHQACGQTPSRRSDRGGHEPATGVD